MVAKYKKLWPPSCDPSVGPIDSTICRFWWTPQKVIFFTGQLCSHGFSLKSVWDLLTCRNWALASSLNFWPISSVSKGSSVKNFAITLWLPSLVMWLLLPLLSPSPKLTRRNSRSNNSSSVALGLTFSDCFLSQVYLARRTLFDCLSQLSNRAHQDDPNNTPQLICKFQVCFPLLWIRINQDNPSSTVKGSQLDTHI